MSWNAAGGHGQASSGFSEDKNENSSVLRLHVSKELVVAALNFIFFKQLLSVVLTTL